MDTSIEEKFVKTFIVKDKRERILYELSSAKKRSVALQRLYNSLDRNFAVLESQKLDEEELIAEIKKYTKANDCYIIAESQHDGKRLPLKEAVEKVLYFGMACVIICDENTVVASEEYNISAPYKVILHKN